MRQDGDRLGSPDAPVSIQVFDDLQCVELPRAVPRHDPALVEDYVRPGDVKLDYRHYSFSPLPEELGFLGAEAAAEQDYAWHYIYLFFRNQDEAERRRHRRGLPAVDRGLDPASSTCPQWQRLPRSEGGAGRRDHASGSPATRSWAADLGIRAEPAAIVSGPSGTRTLQDSPDAWRRSRRRSRRSR